MVWQSEGHWPLEETTDPNAQLELPSVGVELAMTEIYRGLPDLQVG